MFLIQHQILRAVINIYWCMRNKQEEPLRARDRSEGIENLTIFSKTFV